MELKVLPAMIKNPRMQTFWLRDLCNFRQRHLQINCSRFDEIIDSPLSDLLTQLGVSLILEIGSRFIQGSNLLINGLHRFELFLVSEYLFVPMLNRPGIRFTKRPRAFKNGCKSVVISLRYRIKLMIVTANTAESHPQENFAGRI